MTPLLERLGIQLPIIQAPMAGVSSPAMAAAVTQSGALGSLAVGAADACGAEEMIAAFRERSAGPLNVNLFCHRPAVSNVAMEAAWIERARADFAAFEASPPSNLREIYKSFVEDDAMLAMLLRQRPAVVSFHFGLPRPRVRPRRARRWPAACTPLSPKAGKPAAIAGYSIRRRRMIASAQSL